MQNVTLLLRNGITILIYQRVDSRKKRATDGCMSNIRSSHGNLSWAAQLSSWMPHDRFFFIQLIGLHPILKHTSGREGWWSALLSERLKQKNFRRRNAIVATVSLKKPRWVRKALNSRRTIAVAGRSAPRLLYQLFFTAPSSCGRKPHDDCTVSYATLTPPPLPFPSVPPVYLSSDRPIIMGLVETPRFFYTHKPYGVRYLMR